MLIDLGLTSRAARATGYGASAGPDGSSPSCSSRDRSYTRAEKSASCSSARHLPGGTEAASLILRIKFAFPDRLGAGIFGGRQNDECAQ